MIRIEVVKEEHFGGMCTAVTVRRGDQLCQTPWLIGDVGVGPRMARALQEAFPDEPQEHVGFTLEGP